MPRQLLASTGVTTRIISRSICTGRLYSHCTHVVLPCSWDNAHMMATCSPGIDAVSKPTDSQAVVCPCQWVASADNTEC